MADLKAKFDEAAEKIKSFKPSKSVPNERKLVLYANFKQANVGDVNIDRPGMFDATGRAKWDAWNAKKGTSKDDAMEAYIKEVEAQFAEFA